MNTVAIINLDQRFHNECFLCSNPIRVSVGPERSHGLVVTYPDYHESSIREEPWLYILLDEHTGLPTAHLLCGTCGANRHKYVTKEAGQCRKT